LMKRITLFNLIFAKILTISFSPLKSAEFIKIASFATEKMIKASEVMILNLNDTLHFRS